MGLIDKYGQNLVGKLILYVRESWDFSYCFAKVTSVHTTGARCKIFCTNLFSSESQWFSADSDMDRDSKIIEGMNMTYLTLFQKFADPYPKML